MSETRPRSVFPRLLGWLLLLVGLAVFAVRLLQPGAWAMPRGGNLVGGVGCIVIGVSLLSGRLEGPGLAGSLRWLALAATLPILYLGLYAAMAELEEVVVLEATGPLGHTAELRLWIVDDDDGTWVSMGRAKADANDLRDTRAELLRGGERECVVANRFEDRETVTRIHRLRHEKYAVQRFATQIGLFGEAPAEDTVGLRLDPCPEA